MIEKGLQPVYERYLKRKAKTPVPKPPDKPHHALKSVPPKVGKWKVLERSGSDRQGRATWLCECECGTRRTVVGSLLRSGGSKGCGCQVLETKGTKRRPKIKFGDRFGQLVVIGREKSVYDSKWKSYERRWLCQCDCGKAVITREGKLLAGEKCYCSPYCRLVDRTDIAIGSTVAGAKIIARLPKDSSVKNVSARWQVECSLCGRSVVVTTQKLRRLEASGRSADCGCKE
jgi:hypothetical protein